MIGVLATLYFADSSSSASVLTRTASNDFDFSTIRASLKAEPASLRHAPQLGDVKKSISARPFSSALVV